MRRTEQNRTERALAYITCHGISFFWGVFKEKHADFLVEPLNLVRKPHHGTAQASAAVVELVLGQAAHTGRLACVHVAAHRHAHL